MSKCHFFALILVSGLMVLFQNCGTELGDPSFSGDSHGGGSPIVNNVPMAILGFGAVGGSMNPIQATLCIDSLQFKFEVGDPDGNGNEVEFELGEVMLDPNGTSLGSVSLPPATYQEIELELEGDKCPSGQSVIVTNDNGTFQTDEEIEIELNGIFTVEATNNQLTMIFDNIILALNGVSSDEDIKDAIENAIGEFNEDEESSDD